VRTGGGRGRSFDRELNEGATNGLVGEESDGPAPLQLRHERLSPTQRLVWRDSSVLVLNKWVSIDQDRLAHRDLREAYVRGQRHSHGAHVTRLFIVFFGLGTLTACPQPAPVVDPLEAAAAEKCPAVHLDRMGTDWVIESGDPKTRLRIVKDGDKYSAFYVGGLFNAIELTGERREDDVRFVEVPSATKVHFEGKGQAVNRALLYVEPSYRTCALQVFIGRTNMEAEEVPPKPTEFLQMPSRDGVVFSYEPYREPLFVGEAATDKAKADKQIEEAGAPLPDTSGGDVVVSTWSNAATDGDVACTYDMDLYFDDLRLNDKQAQPAGAVTGEFRLWTATFDAKYNGNHSFQLHRFKTCEGGGRELIGTAGIEAILHY